MSCPTVLCSVPPGASGSQAFTLLQSWLCPYHQILANLKQAGVKGKWLQSALLIELHWPFCNKWLFKKRQWESNYSLLFHWEGWRVQSTLLHLDGDVEQVVVAFTPAKHSSILSAGGEILIDFLCDTCLQYKHTYIFLVINRIKEVNNAGN